MVRDDQKHIITPHESLHDIELFWVSIQQKNKRPIFCGVYYGKQESCTNQDMKLEMEKLCEEITEKRKEGEIMIFTDGNAKINILNEGISRNGRLLLEVINECELDILNLTDKCKGRITRLNRGKKDENSAIDFVLTGQEITHTVQEMLIDEDEHFLLKGKAPTDHNSIVLKLNMNDAIKRKSLPKVVKWRLTAPENQWADFDEKLRNSKTDCYQILLDPKNDFDTNYKIYTNRIEEMARETIGKTTINPNRSNRESRAVKELRSEKRFAKKDFEKETDEHIKGQKLEKYYKKQIELRQLISEENELKVRKKFEKMMSEQYGFWDACRRQKADPLNHWTAVKDEAGQRILDPESQKIVIGNYVQGLYSPDLSLPSHEHHAVILRKLNEYDMDRNHEHHEYNEVPTMAEVMIVIENKKNSKSTTDFPNEMLKKGGRGMVEWIYPLVKVFWEKEILPRIWNNGIITFIHKGKGDREIMNNQRGITVSSTISMICEELINVRMTRLVPLTQAQGGGKKGSATRDHLFILRGAMAIAMKHKREIYVTFFDVSKAYDRTSVEDMLVEMWDHGLKGKLWRLLKLLNTNLTCQVKTRHGLTEEIKRIVGGKQGGKHFGFLFAKLMDLLQEESQDNNDMGVHFDILKLIFLIWVDDVLSFAEGEQQQNLTLQMVNEFAIKHKLKWGVEKCKVMQIGKSAYVQQKWKLGGLDIDSCDHYKYLGDIVMRNNGNQKNIEEREKTVKFATRQIISWCSSETISGMEVQALLRQHESKIIPTLLSNCETWVLGKEQRRKLERIELWALKKMFCLPPTTPTRAVIVATGCLFTSQRIDKKQLIYLKTILSRPEDDWTKKSLYVQKSENIWWAKQINELLDYYDLDYSWDDIKSMPFAEWKRRVSSKIELKHIDRIKETLDGTQAEKTKTNFIQDLIEKSTYSRQPMTNILNRSKMGAKAIIMGMSGMLDCANNYHFKYKSKTCNVCKEIDDESHRINYCKKYAYINLFESEHKFDFSNIYSKEKEEVDKVEYVIRHLWDISNGKNQMKPPVSQSLALCVHY